MLGALTRATFERTVFTVPAGSAQAGAVLALAMFITPSIAESFLAEFAGPTGLTDASAGLATSVHAAIDGTSRFRTIVTSPTGRTNATVEFEAERALSEGTGAVRQTLHRLRIDQTAVGAFPAFLTDTDTTVSAVAVIRARWMRTVHNVAEFAFITAAADTFAGRVAFSVTRAVGYFTLVVLQTTFTSFPARITLATAVHIVASSAA